MLLTVLCDVLLNSIDGDKVLFHDVDLDYWTIRHWRKLYLRLLDLNSKFPYHFYNIRIMPKQKEF